MHAEDKFTIGRVFSLLPKVLGQESISLWQYLGSLAAILGFLRIALEQGTRVPSPGSGHLMALAFSVISGVASGLVHCAAIQAADMRLNGTPVQASVALHASFSRFWPYVGLSVLLSLVLFVGFLALVIPGIFVLVVFSLALPALVIRRTGVFDSLRASWTMTKGHRLEILGFWLVFGLASGLLFAAVFLLAIVVLYLTGLAGGFGQTLLALIVDAFLSSLVLVVGGAVSATMFRLIDGDTPNGSL